MRPPDAGCGHLSDMKRTQTDLTFRTHLQFLRDLAAIHRAILHGDRTNSGTLSEALGIDRKAVFRLLEFLRQLGAPVKWDGLGYVYSKPWDFPAALGKWTFPDDHRQASA